MTQEHRDQFLAMEGWQKTERGYFRKDGFQYSEDTGAVRVTHMTQRSRKFRRFPFGRQPKHDAMVGWFVTDSKIRHGNQLELSEWAEEAERIGDDETKKWDWMRLMVKFHMQIYPLTKRQGWDKYGEVMG